MKKAFSSLFLTVIVALILSSAPKMPAAQAAEALSAEDKALKAELNKAWNEAAAAVHKKDYKAFLKAVDFSRKPEETIGEQDFPRYAALVGRVLAADRLNNPRLTPAALRKNEHWAAYYTYSLDEGSPGQSMMALDMALFRKEDGRWKLSLPLYGDTFAKKPSEADNQKEALRLIETKPDFKLPSRP